ncbi:MAG TPA: glycosyltransferase family 2 protein [Bacteroidales bacterium]|nr:glycosyltransferase family 2 protein [Bacteroidales bacterium]
MVKISVVVTVYNEEDNVLPLFAKIVEALQDESFEVIFVNDGSTDRTLSKILSISDPRVKLIEFRKNYGQSAALAAGIKAASGSFIVTMDGDLQNDPADIPMMVATAEQGDYDLVAGNRVDRKDDFFIRKIPSFIANRIIMRATGVRIKDNGCALKVFKAELVKSIGIYGEMHRFIAVLAALEGARITQVDVRHHPRIHGSSKYGLSRTFKVISDLLLLVFNRRYLQRPMHFFGKWGGLIFLAGAIINLYLLVIKLMGEDIGGKPLLFLGVMMVITGFQLITTGIIIELQMRTYYESQEKPHYQIRNLYQGGQKV